jgi:outer membrane receptor protein involved in Fe transport
MTRQASSGIRGGATALAFVFALFGPGPRGIPEVRAGDAGRGRVVGSVVSSETGEPLAFTNIVLFDAGGLEPKTGGARRAEAGGAAPDRESLGAPVAGASSMTDGSYRIDVAPGTYWLVASYVSYNPLHVEGVVVKAGEVVTIDLPLVPEAVKIETVEVTASALRSTEAALLLKQRKAGAVSDAVSHEQIAKTADANAAEVLRRVTGLSVVDGRFVYVRGLGERYSSTEVNGIAVGNPEPNRRVLALDLFASSLIDNVEIQKTYTPDRPGDFGGGVVNINTRDFPGRKRWSASASSGYNAKSTGKTFLTYGGGHTDYLGIDDGTRDVPDAVFDIAGDAPVTMQGPAGGGFTPAELERITRAFRNTWTPQRKSARPAANFGGSYADETRVLGRPLGFSASGSYSRGYQTTREDLNSYDAELGALTDYDVEKSESSVLWGGVLASSYRLHRSHTLTLRTMYNRSAEDEVRLTEGRNNDISADMRITRLRYVERGLFCGSAGMEHALRPLFGSTFDWRVSYSRATRSEPDRRESVYQKSSEAVEDPGGGPSTVRESYILAFTGSFPPLSRMYGTLRDEERGVDGSWTIPFRSWSGLDAKLKTGFLLGGKDRVEGYRRFRYRIGPQARQVDTSLPPEALLSDENVAVQKFLLLEDTRDTDNYTAQQRTAAQYAMFDLPLTKRLRLVTGARIERVDQTVETQALFVRSGQVVRASLSDTDVLPSVNLTYGLRENMNLRGAFSRTVNRPDLRELTPLSLTDYSTVTAEAGNPELQRALITNYDLRWEVYPTHRELLAVSAFYKRLRDPIEKTVLITPAPAYQPQNGEGGRLYGVEIEARLGLDRVARSLGALAAATNLTFVDSETRIARGEQTSKERPLHGQSPYVANVGLFYGAKSGRLSGSLLYNVFGKRLAYVGVGVIPDIYEMPRHAVDMTMSCAVGPSVKLRFAAENLLNDEVRFEQGDAAHPTSLHRRGRSVSLALSTGA